MYTNKCFGLKLFSEQTYPLKAIPRPMTYTSHPTAERAISGMTNWEKIKQFALMVHYGCVI